MRLLLIRLRRFTRSSFFGEVTTLHDSSALHVLPGVVIFGLIAAIFAAFEYYTPADITLGVEVTVFEVGGAILTLLLVLRVNEGLGRWWEGRKLWGGINNQCRSLAIAGLAFGPADPAWRRALVHWTIVFAHVCRRSLRDERTLPEIAALVGEAEADRVAAASHMPSHVALVLARILRTAVDRLGMDRFAFLQADKERATLVDHIGGCERILSTPMPRALSIQIRRFVFLFLLLLPLGLIPKFNAETVRAARQASRAATAAMMGSKPATAPSPATFAIPHDHLADRVWFIVPITMLVAFPLLALDKISSDLQKPFWIRSINDLKLDTYTTNIERTLLALLRGGVGEPEITGLLIELEGTAAEVGEVVAKLDLP
jgi:ion channel-forming bestrophin family protein